MTFRVLKEMMYIFYVPGLNTVTRDFKLKVEYRTPFIKICFSVIWSTHIHTVNQGTRQPPVTYCKPLQTMKFPSPTPRLHRSDRSLLRGGNTFLEPEAGFFFGGKRPRGNTFRKQTTIHQRSNWWLTAFYPTNPWWKEWSNWEYLYSKPIKHHNQETVANQNNSSKSRQTEPSDL